MDHKYVYLFTEGNACMRNLLAARAQTSPNDQHRPAVPQGFTITTEACTRYYEDGERIAPEIESQNIRVSGQAGGDLREKVR